MKKRHLLRGLCAATDLSARTLSQKISEKLGQPVVVDKLLRFGIEPIGGTPAQFTTLLASESAKWKKIITERQITLD